MGREVTSRHNTPNPLCSPGFKATAKEDGERVTAYANTEEEAIQRANEQLDALLDDDD
jgi:hypothetical protein